MAKKELKKKTNSKTKKEVNLEKIKKFKNIKLYEAIFFGIIILLLEFIILLKFALPKL